MNLKIVQHSPRANIFLPLILVAEEDPDTRLMLKYLLEMWKYQVIEAKDDLEAIQMAMQCRPDLVLISRRLDKIDDFAVSRRMRELPELEKMKIVFISTYSNADIRGAARAAGCDGFLGKPIDFGKLETMLETFLKNNYRQTKRFIGEV